MSLQFHWNNYERRADYVDSSGLTLFYTPELRANDAAIMMIGQLYLEIPPHKDRVEATAVCSPEDTRIALTGPVNISRAFNHMHYLGTSNIFVQLWFVWNWVYIAMKPYHENKLYKKLQVYHLLVILVFHNCQNAVFLIFNCYNILNWYKND